MTRFLPKTTHGIDFQKAFCHELAAAWHSDTWQDLHVVVAVSGGADSVALLRALIELKRAKGGAGQIFAAHFNHKLRPEADHDQRWVAELCQSLGIPLETGHATWPSAGPAPAGVEEAARDARYCFLTSCAERLGARFVVTAHTASDQAETVLHHIVRGTGLRGLAGMRRRRPLTESVMLIRPLLALWRTDVERYLQALSQEYRRDQTNLDESFTRNRLRHDLLPKLRADYNTQVDTALVRLAQQALAAEEFIAASASSLLSSCVIQLVPQQRVLISRRPILDQPELLLCELCRQVWEQAEWPTRSMGYEEWRHLTAMLLADEQPQVITLPGGIRAASDASELVLSREVNEIAGLAPD